MLVSHLYDTSERFREREEEVDERTPRHSDGMSVSSTEEDSDYCPHVTT